MELGGYKKLLGKVWSNMLAIRSCQLWTAVNSSF